MKRVVLLLSVALTASGVTSAQPPAAADDRDQVVCTLLGNCGGQPDAASPPSGPARSGATRGFSFTRTTETAPPRTAAPGKPARRPMRKPPAGVYDLRVTFLSGSAEVGPDSESRIRSFAGALNDPRLAARRIRIEGHTDSVGDAASNLDLSQRRAHAVADLVVADGVDAARLDVQGFGSRQPLPGTGGRDPANRRVVATLAR